MLLLPYFNEIENSEKLINTLLYYRNYYRIDFDTPYKELRKFLSIEEMKNRDISNENKLESLWKNLISIIHNMEGYTCEYLTVFIINHNYSHNVYNALFYLGISSINFIKNWDEFYYFENAIRNQNFQIDELKNHIDNLYMEEHLQIMQCTYTLSKIEKISTNKIKKLVITNPYTKGLKNLMLAFNSDNIEEKNNLFEIAIINLKHIKYYYLECLYYYAIFLKETDSEKYEEVILEGLELAQKYKYQYINHLFDNLVNNMKSKYDFSYSYYQIEGLERFVENYL